MERKKIKTTKAERVAYDLDALARSLGSGERLPSVRKLCKDMGISLATLNTAMRTLEARGIIERRHGSGVYVTDQISIARVAVVVNAAFYLAGGSPVWGMILGEILRALRGNEFEASIYLAQPGDHDGLAKYLPTDFELAVEQGRVDGVIAIGLELELIEGMEERGLKPVSFAGPGSLNLRVNITRMAQELAKLYVAEGKTTAMLVGCHHKAHWDEVRKSIEAAGMKVLPATDSHWEDQGLVKRMARPYLHLGQDFAQEFQRSIQNGVKPDVLFVMDDTFAQGFLMVWRNSPDRFSVDLACHSNRELRLYMGWEGRLGLMEVEILKLTKILVEGVRVVLENPDGSGEEWAEQIRAKEPDIAMGLVDENGRQVITLKWKASLLDGTPAFAK